MRENWTGSEINVKFGIALDLNKLAHSLKTFAHISEIPLTINTMPKTNFQYNDPDPHFLRCECFFLPKTATKS